MEVVEEPKRKRTDEEPPRRRKRVRRTPAILAILELDHLKHIALAIRSYVDLVYFASACKEFREAAIDTYKYYQRHPEKMPFAGTAEKLVLDWSTVVTPLRETMPTGLVKTRAPAARIEEACTLHKLDREDAIVAAAASWDGYRALKYLMTSEKGEPDLLACAVAAASVGCVGNLYCIQRHCFKRRIIDVTQLEATVVAAVRNDRSHLLVGRYFTDSYYGGAAAQDGRVGRPRGLKIVNLVGLHAPAAGAWNIWARFADRLSEWSAAPAAAEAGQIEFLVHMRAFGRGGGRYAIYDKATVDAAIDAGQHAVVEWLATGMHKDEVRNAAAWGSILRYYLMRGEYTRATDAFDVLYLRYHWYDSSAEIAFRRVELLDFIMHGCARAGRIDCLAWGYARGWKPGGVDLASAIAGNKRHAVNWIQARIVHAEIAVQAAYVEAAKHTRAYVWQHLASEYDSGNDPSYAWLVWLVERYPPATRSAYSQAAIVTAVDRESGNGAVVCPWLTQNGFPSSEKAMQYLYSYRVH